MAGKRGHGTAGLGRKPGVPNKATRELREFAGQYTTAAIEGLAKIAKSSKQDAARVAAWREILDRAVGKAPQAVTGPEGERLTFPAAISFILRQQPGSDNQS